MLGVGSAGVAGNDRIEDATPPIGSKDASGRVEDGGNASGRQPGDRIIGCHPLPLIEPPSLIVATLLTRGSAAASTRLAVCLLPNIAAKGAGLAIPGCTRVAAKIIRPSVAMLTSITIDTASMAVALLTRAPSKGDVVDHPALGGPDK
ncbi:MAG: hypothetical protein FRX49_08639 [Trebouxia sp. A1-2]|nr:MAG: hypothetical protein FRX49_08639 [Trebouxia sp. A1-2]